MSSSFLLVLIMYRGILSKKKKQLCTEKLIRQGPKIEKETESTTNVDLSL